MRKKAEKIFLPLGSHAQVWFAWLWQMVELVVAAVMVLVGR
mgnify:CR=1 FL=1